MSTGAQRDESQPVEVAYFVAHCAITIAREPEVGIAWEATCGPLGLSALGETPKEALHNLIAFINRRGISGRGATIPGRLKKIDTDGGMDGPDGY